MATSYPSTQDTLTNPTASDKTNSVTVPHATQHANANDAIRVLQARVGYSSSTAAGIATPSTNVGDVFYVSDSAGRTRFGPAAMVKLGEVSATSTAIASLGFTGIPQTFRGLRAEMLARDGTTSTAALVLPCVVQFNSDTAANYALNGFLAIGSTYLITETYGTTGVNLANIPQGGVDAKLVGSLMMDIPDYTSTLGKSITSVGAVRYTTSSGAGRTLPYHADYFSTSPITALSIAPIGGTFVTGSRLTLWGKPQ